jgi:hypothetical protein
MNARGIRSSVASSSSENRGHSGENEQHAPQARHMADPSSRIAAATIGISFHKRRRSGANSVTCGSVHSMFGEDMRAQRVAKAEWSDYPAKCRLPLDRTEGRLLQGRSLIYASMTGFFEF